MSLELMPDELLLNIAQLLVEACRKEDVLYGFDQTPRPSSLPVIWCRDETISALAGVNTRMRRICFRILFSGIILQGSGQSQNGTDVALQRALELLFKILRSRPEIAKCVKCIQAHEPVDCRSDFLSGSGLETLCHVIQMLPNLTSICGLRVDANQTLIDVVNDCHSLEKLELFDFPIVRAGEVPAELRPQYLAKFVLSFIWLMAGFTPVRTLFSFIKEIEIFNSLLDMGLHVSSVHITADLSDDISSGTLSRLRAVPGLLGCISVWIDGTEPTDVSPEPIYDEVRDVLRAWSKSGSASSIPEIGFTDTYDHPHRLPPLMPDVRGTCFKLWAYTMRPTLVTNNTPAEVSDIWQQGWTIVRAKLIWSWWQFPAAGVSLASQTPAIEHLEISKGDSENTAFPITPEVMAKLARCLGHLPQLRELSLIGCLVSENTSIQGGPDVHASARAGGSARHRATDLVFAVLCAQAPNLERIHVIESNDDEQSSNKQGGSHIDDDEASETTSGSVDSASDT